MRILIVAHELSPFGGSECAVGWNIVTRLSAYHNVTVLYASGSQFRDNSYVDAINKYFIESPHIDRLTLINIDKPRISKLFVNINRIFKKLTPVGLPILYYLGYKHWQKSAFYMAKQLNQECEFDIFHQLTQISYREPGYLWKLGKPFFWGPTGGTFTFPKSFYSILSIQSKVLDTIRTLSTCYQFKFTPRIINANKKAVMIYTFSGADAKRFAKRANGQVKILLDVGAYTETDANSQMKDERVKIRGIWCGRLDEFKAPLLLLKALAKSQITREEIEIQVIGSGPIEQEIIKMSEDLKLNNINWLKQVDHREVFKLMGDADFFIHTSIREATSSVIMEALSKGLPVICHDAFGMSEAINETCGIKIPLISPGDSINGFHNAMTRLAMDRKLLDGLKDGAKRRSVEISWDKMAQMIANDYSNLCTRNHNESLSTTNG